NKPYQNQHPDSQKPANLIKPPQPAEKMLVDVLFGLRTQALYLALALFYFPPPAEFSSPVYSHKLILLKRNDISHQRQRKNDHDKYGDVVQGFVRTAPHRIDFAAPAQSSAKRSPTGLYQD